MTVLAGFAAVAAVGEQAAADAVRISYAGGMLQRSYTSTDMALDTAALGPVAVQADLYLDLPELHFRAQDGPRVAITVRARGTLAVRQGDPVAGGLNVARRLVVGLQLLATPALTVTGDGISVGLGVVTLTGFDIEQVIGGDFPEPIASLVDAPETLAALNTLLGAELGQLSDLFSLQVPYLTDPAVGGLLQIAPAGAFHAFDGALVVGLDTIGAVSTAGDPAQLVDFRGEQDVAFYVSAHLGDAMFAGVRKELKDSIELEPPPPPPDPPPGQDPPPPPPPQPTGATLQT